MSDPADLPAIIPPAINDPLPVQVETLIRALQKSLNGFERKILERDALELSGEIRRAKIAKAQIQELLNRLQSGDVKEALSKPLSAAFKDGYGDYSFPRENVSALVDSLIAPLQNSLGRSKSFLPYIAPKLSEPDRKSMIELSIEAVTSGMTTKQLAKRIFDEIPGARIPMRGEVERGTTLENVGGQRVSIGQYAEILARNTTYRAANEGTLSQCEDNGIELVEISVSPYAIDFCLDFKDCVFAVNDQAAETWGVPLLSECPNGGPGFHVNCRCRVKPKAALKKQAGNLKTAPDDVLTASKDKEAQDHAEAAFQKRLESDPIQYADQIAESAAVRGFGGKTSLVPAELVGEKIPGLVGKIEYFGKRAFNEDIQLANAKLDNSVNSRKELRYTVAETLRSGEAEKTSDGFLKYTSKETGWSVIVNPRTGLVTKAQSE